MGSFVNPGFLVWLLPLAAVPVIIHLLNRRRWRNVPWAAMRFLEAAFKRTNRRIRIENLLLLAIRVAVMALLVLGLSRPVVSRGSALAILGQEKRNLILVLDTSYSMGYRPGITEANFDRALEIAKRIVGELDGSRGDTLTLIAAGPEPEVLEERSVWIEKGLEDLTSVEASAGAVNLESLFLRILEICDHPEMKTRTEIVFVSDFQRRDWAIAEETDETTVDTEPAAAVDEGGPPEGEAEGDAAAEPRTPAPRALREILAELAEREIPVMLVDVGSPKSLNFAVARLAVDERAIGVRRPVRIEVAIANRGTEEAPCSLSMFVGEDKVATESLGILFPGETRTATLFHAFGTAGDAGVRVEVDREVKDGLPADDARYLAVEVVERIRVLVVDGNPSTGEFLESETGYLKLALDPGFRSETSAESLFAVDEAFDYDLPLKVFTEYDWIALADVAELPEAKARELARALRGGVGLLISVGNRIDPAAWNEHLLGDGESRIFPGRFLEPVTPLDASAGYELVIHDFEHPVLRFFADEILRPLLTGIPKTTGFLGYDPGPGLQAPRVLARFNDASDSPALVEWTAGSGRALLLTTTVNDAWTDLPRTPGFLPFVQEIGTYLPAKDLARRNLEAGQPLALELTRFSPNAWIELPTGERRRVELQALDEEESRFGLVFEDTARPGIYRIGGLPARSAAEVAAASDLLFCANLDPDEGDLRRIPEDEIRARFPEFRFRWVREYTREADSHEAPREGEIWKYLLMAVLALLFVEGFLAQFFGDYARR